MTIWLVSHADTRASGRAAWWDAVPLFANPHIGDWAQAWRDGWRIGEREFAAVCSKRSTPKLLAQYRPADIHPPRRRSRYSRSATGRMARAASQAATGQDFSMIERVS